MLDNDKFNKSCEWCRKMNKIYSVKESSLTFAEWCYQQGAKGFVEWLTSKYRYATEDIEEDFAEWQKSKK